MTLVPRPFSPRVVTFWRRSWLLFFLVVLVLRAYVSGPAGTWTLDKLTAAAVPFIIFTVLLWILDNNARAFEVIRNAFERIAAADQERTQRLRMLRIATESLATTLELIREDLAQNTAVTKDGVKASETAAQLAAKAAAVRDTVARDLKAEIDTAGHAREEIKAAIEKVHDTALAAYKEANHVSDKFQDVNTNIQQLNERLLHQEESKSSDTPPTAEASLHRIDDHTAAIDNTLSRLSEQRRDSPKE